MSHAYADRYRTGDLSNATKPERNLWAEVLCLLIDDALLGVPPVVHASKTYRIRETYAARSYFKDPSPSLRIICELVGLDPVAVRERIVKQIDAAPTPEELINAPRKIKSYRTFRTRAGRRKSDDAEPPGVGQDFAGVSGTGGGTIEQDGPKIGFSGKAA